jgi:hypothetical protein
MNAACQEPRLAVIYDNGSFYATFFGARNIGRGGRVEANSVVIDRGDSASSSVTFGRLINIEEAFQTRKVCSLLSSSQLKGCPNRATRQRAAPVSSCQSWMRRGQAAIRLRLHGFGQISALHRLHWCRPVPWHQTAALSPPRGPRETS